MDKNISIINSHIFLNKQAWTKKVLSNENSRDFPLQ